MQQAGGRQALGNLVGLAWLGEIQCAASRVITLPACLLPHSGYVNVLILSIAAVIIQTLHVGIQPATCIILYVVCHYSNSYGY